MEKNQTYQGRDEKAHSLENFIGGKKQQLVRCGGKENTLQEPSLSSNFSFGELTEISNPEADTNMMGVHPEWQESTGSGTR